MVIFELTILEIIEKHNGQNINFIFFFNATLVLKIQIWI